MNKTPLIRRAFFNNPEQILNIKKNIVIKSRLTQAYLTQR